MRKHALVQLWTAMIVAVGIAVGFGGSARAQIQDRPAYNVQLVGVDSDDLTVDACLFLRSSGDGYYLSSVISNVGTEHAGSFALIVRDENGRPLARRGFSGLLSGADRAFAVLLGTDQTEVEALSVGTNLIEGRTFSLPVCGVGAR